jgi:hypothetical protein
MSDRDRLSSLILEHWQTHCPNLLAGLKDQNSVEAALEATSKQVTEMLFQLISQRKMQHHQAWEIMLAEIFPPEESSSMQNPKEDHRAISESRKHSA